MEAPHQTSSVDSRESRAVNPRPSTLDPHRGPYANGSRYFVATGNSGGWLVFKEGIHRPVRKMAEKLQALETARIMARDEAPSQVFVEKPDGSFFEQYAFSNSHAH